MLPGSKWSSTGRLAQAAFMLLPLFPPAVHYLEIWSYRHIKCVKKKEVISIWSEATEQHKASLVFGETLDQVFCCKCVMYLFDVLMCHKVSLRFTLQVRANYEASWIIEQIKDIKPATVIALKYDSDCVFIFRCCIYIFFICMCVFYMVGIKCSTLLYAAAFTTL